VLPSKNDNFEIHEKEQSPRETSSDKNGWNQAGRNEQQNNFAQYIYTFTSAGSSVPNTKIVAPRESNMDVVVLIHL